MANYLGPLVIAEVSKWPTMRGSTEAETDGQIVFEFEGRLRFIVRGQLALRCRARKTSRRLDGRVRQGIGT